MIHRNVRMHDRSVCGWNELDRTEDLDQFRTDADGNAVIQGLLQTHMFFLKGRNREKDDNCADRQPDKMTPCEHCCFLLLNRIYYSIIHKQ